MVYLVIAFIVIGFVLFSMSAKNSLIPSGFRKEGRECDMHRWDEVTFTAPDGTSVNKTTCKKCGFVPSKELYLTDTLMTEIRNQDEVNAIVKQVRQELTQHLGITTGIEGDLLHKIMTTAESFGRDVYIVKLNTENFSPETIRDALKGRYIRPEPKERTHDDK